VRYSETDAMGIVYHANYLVWFEVARTELFRRQGLPYTRFEAEGLALAVIDAKLRYRSAAKYDDELDLKAEIVTVNPRKIVFNYLITCGKRVMCEGSTAHLFINRQDGSAVSAAKYPIWKEVQLLFKP